MPGRFGRRVLGAVPHRWRGPAHGRPGRLPAQHPLFYHRALTQAPWYRDLELARRGAHYLEPELNVVMLTRDGRALEWWTDFEKTVASFARFDRRDAERLRYWRDAFRPIVQHILIPEAQAPPLPPEVRQRAASGSSRRSPATGDERLLAARVCAARISPSPRSGRPALF